MAIAERTEYPQSFLDPRDLPRSRDELIAGQGAARQLSAWQRRRLVSPDWPPAPLALIEESNQARFPSYADQNERDYGALQRAVREGRIEASREDGDDE